MTEQKKTYQPPVKRTDMDTLYPMIEPIINSGGTVKMKVTGCSMYPLIGSRRDSVLLGKADKVRIGDVSLFQRSDGRFVLHRIVGEKDGAFYFCGDYEVKKEYPVYPNQIVAVAKGFYRNERFISCDSLLYKLYCFFWRGTFWIRPFLLWSLAVYTHQKKLKRMKQESKKSC